MRGLPLSRCAAALALLLSACAGTAGRGPGATPAERDRAGLVDPPLVTHRGEEVRLSELLRDRVVVLAFTYVRCAGSCPLTLANLRRVQAALGPRAGDDVAILSITLDPEHDTPEVLAAHALANGAEDGWTFLTGAPADVDAVRARFGFVDRAPAADADRGDHAAMVVIGDAAANRWLSLPALGPPREIARAALRLAGAERAGRRRPAAAEARATSTR